MTGLPDVPTEAAWDDVPRDHPSFAEVARELGVIRGFTDDALERFEAGSLPVFAAGAGEVLKLYPPPFADEARRERRVCAWLHTRLPESGPNVPWPLDDGAIDGWRYVWMTRVPGTPLDTRWDALDDDARRDVCAQIGAWTRALHALDVDAELDAIYPRGNVHGDWARFVSTQRANCVQSQRDRGLDAAWCDALDRDRAALEVVPTEPDRRVLLHTELMNAHALVAPVAGEGSGRVQLTGFVDFEPAMVGDPEYDLASVCIFVVGGRPELWAAFLDGYGTPTPGWQDRVLAWLLLHRYSRLSWFLDVLPQPKRVDVRALRDAWFPG